MSTLFNVVFAWKCSSTHHKIALDALNQSSNSQAEKWSNLCLANVDAYLEGSKAPDNTFKDFRNHVLHTRENNWGGAIATAEHWYGVVVDCLKQQKWKQAVYSAGVLSHYFSDPFMPLHTGQTEAEGSIHRPLEWSIACAYRDITDVLMSNLGGWPEVSVPSGSDWMSRMILAGAQSANRHYEACLDHYNLKLGVKNPPLGLDQELKIRLAGLLGQAVVGYARVLDRALDESHATLPKTDISLRGVLATLQIPILWVTKKLKDAKERSIVEAMYAEFQKTGKVLATLPEDDRVIREMHADEVLHKPIDDLNRERPIPIGTAFGTRDQSRPQTSELKESGISPIATVTVTPSPVDQPTSPQTTKRSALSITMPAPEKTSKPAEAKKPSPADRFYLASDMSVEKAPVIGPQTATRLESQGVITVNDLLKSDPKRLAAAMNDSRINASTISDWQKLAALCCEVPNLRGHDAQLLLASGVTQRSELASADANQLLKKVKQVADTSAGKRILRGGAIPDMNEVNDWISWASRTQQHAA